MAAYLYLDESGALRLRPGASNYFIVAVLRTAAPPAVRQVIERARRHTLPPRLRHLPEIKSSLASDKFLRLAYRGLARVPLEIHTLVLDTTAVPHFFRGKQGLLYLHLAGEAISHALSRDDLIVYLSLDRRHLQGFARPDFDEHLRARLSLGLPGNAYLEVFHRDSTVDPGIQAADLACWALYQKYQYDNLEWYEMIEPLVETETVLFEHK